MISDKQQILVGTRRITDNMADLHAHLMDFKDDKMKVG